MSYEKWQRYFLFLIERSTHKTRLSIRLLNAHLQNEPSTKCYSCFLYWQITHVSSWTISVIFLEWECQLKWTKTHEWGKCSWPQLQILAIIPGSWHAQAGNIGQAAILVRTATTWMQKADCIRLHWPKHNWIEKSVFTSPRKINSVYFTTPCERWKNKSVVKRGTE